jgi:hypothetical protein
MVLIGFSSHPNMDLAILQQKAFVVMTVVPLGNSVAASFWLSLLNTKYRIFLPGTMLANFFKVVVLPVPALASIIKSLG